MPNYGPISSTLPSGQRPSLRKGAGCLNYSHNLNGTVTEVKVSFVLRIPHNGEITSSRTYNGIKFYLYKKNSPTVASLPDDWTQHSGFYYGSTSLSKSYIPEENILAQNLNFSLGPTDKISNNCSATFELTDFGKNLSNWSGEVILACVDHGTEKNGRTEILQWSTGSTCSYTLTYLEQSVIPTSSLTPITLGTTSTINFISYSSSYSHEITWKLGSKSQTINTSAGKTSASYSIPTSWRDQFSTTDSTKKGNISIKTKDSSGNQIGVENSYEVTYNIDNYDLSTSINLTCSKVSPLSSERFSNSIFNDYLIKNYHKIKFIVSTKAEYNNEIIECGLTYSNNARSKGITSITKDYIYSGETVVYDIKDSRGKTARINFIISSSSLGKTLTAYTPCSYSSIEFYRATESGEKNELGGSCVKVIINNFKLSTTSSSRLDLSTSINIRVGNGTKTITPTASGTVNTTITDANLSADTEYQLTITFSDNSGLSTSFTGKILSSNYLLHFRKNQKSVGVGHAARDITSGSYSDYSEGLLSINYQIELARGLGSQKCFTSPIRTVDGGTGCSDLDDFVDKIASSILAKAYPIGSLYFTTNATNPKNILGFGTWTAWGQGKVPIGVNSSNSNFNSPEKTGGQEQITLTEEQMPKHKHYPLKKSESAAGSDRATKGTDFSENATDNSEAWSFQVATHIDGTTKRVRKGSSSNEYIIANEDIGSLWTDVSTGYAGESKSFSIMQPYITCYMWKRTA